MINLYFISHDRFPPCRHSHGDTRIGCFGYKQNGRLITPPVFRHYQGRLQIKRPQNQP